MRLNEVQGVAGSNSAPRFGGLGFSAQWCWRNEGTIESKLVVAVEAGKYNNGKKRFESAR